MLGRQLHLLRSKNIWTWRKLDWIPAWTKRALLPSLSHTEIPKRFEFSICCDKIGTRTNSWMVHSSILRTLAYLIASRVGICRAKAPFEISWVWEIFSTTDFPSYRESSCCQRFHICLSKDRTEGADIGLFTYWMLHHSQWAQSWGACERQCSPRASIPWLLQELHF